MSYNVNIEESLHQWEKTNLVTIPGRKGHYDNVVCLKCGMKGRRYNFDFVSIPENYKKQDAYKCTKAPDFILPKKVKVICCYAHGGQFENAKPDTEHLVITPPDGYKNDHTGVWVMGNGEPIKLLTQEFQVIK